VTPPGRSSRHIVLVTLGNLSSPVVALISAPLLAQGLGVDDRGELAAATAPLFLAASALTLGLPDAITHFTARSRAYSRRSMGANLLVLTALGLVGSAMIFLLAPLLSAGSEELARLIRISALALTPALWVGAGRGFARGLHLWRWVVAEQLIGAGIKLAGVTSLFLLGALTPLSAAVLLSAALFIGGVIYVALGPALTRGRSSVSNRRVAIFGLAVWPGVLAGVVLSRLDQTLILPLSSAAALGVYAVAVSIADSARVFNIAVRDVIFARESASSDDSALALASRLSTMITAALAVCVVGLAFVVVVPLFGEDFSQVPLVVAVILAGAVVGNPGSVVAAGVSARGRAGLRSIAIMTGVVINVGLLLLLVPSWGALGAAGAAAIANSLTGLLVVAMAWRVFGIRPSQVLRLHLSDVAELRTLAAGLRRR
jgi:O-antigen/teichoic acid export membrane protein